LNVSLELLQPHSKVQSYEDAFTIPNEFRRYIRVSWNCKWLKVGVSSLNLSCLHRSGKLVKSGSGAINNLRTISRKVCCNIQLLLSGLPTHPTNQHESFQRVLSSLTCFHGNFSEGHRSQNDSMSIVFNCGALMAWATKKKMHLIGIGSTNQFL